MIQLQMRPFDAACAKIFLNKKAEEARDSKGARTLSRLPGKSFPPSTSLISMVFALAPAFFIA